MATNHFHAVTPGIDHGHVRSIERRLAPWRIEQQVLDKGGVAAEVPLDDPPELPVVL